jgi:hypothetical protein
VQKWLFHKQQWAGKLSGDIKQSVRKAGKHPQHPFLLFEDWISWPDSPMLAHSQELRRRTLWRSVAVQRPPDARHVREPIRVSRQVVLKFAQDFANRYAWQRIATKVAALE